MHEHALTLKTHSYQLVQKTADNNMRVDMNLKGTLPVIIKDNLYYWVSCYNMVWDYFFIVFTTVVRLGFYFSLKVFPSNSQLSYK